MQRREFLKFMGVVGGVTLFGQITLEPPRFIEMPMDEVRPMTFQDMLNEYLPYELLRDEIVKKNYLLNSIPKDTVWAGARLVVPFASAGT